jgi:3-oxoacyl-[acyl-carrier-protein] synthase II
MTAFINGIGLISPQKTAETPDFLTEIMEYESDYLKCIEPVYKNYINPLAARRMSRLIKMGITAAKLCLQDAGIEMPDAIITGTGLGSVEDTEAILSHIHDDSVLFNPTPFMQSTYNTISSQIAISLKCHGYNSTYTHRSFSFESVLLDALMQLEDGEAANILAGGIDEMSMDHLSLIRRLGHWKRQPANNLKLLEQPSPGALAGEGAGYFLLSNSRNEHSYAKIRAVSTFYMPGSREETTGKITAFLAENKLPAGDVDILLTGISGDSEFDPVYFGIAGELFPGTCLTWYKHLCGEYHTSTSFALWLAANIIKRNILPGSVLLRGNKPSSIRNILIYNQYRDMQHSLILVSGI